MTNENSLEDTECGLLYKFEVYVVSSLEEGGAERKKTYCENMFILWVQCIAQVSLSMLWASLHHGNTLKKVACVSMPCQDPEIKENIKSPLTIAVFDENNQKRHM